MRPGLTLEYIILSISLAIHVSLCAVPLRSDCTLYSEAANIQCLTASNVASHLSHSPNLWLLEFYSSYCGHCISFAPTFQRLSNSIKEWNRFVRLGVLDCAPSMNRGHVRFKSISPLSMWLQIPVLIHAERSCPLLHLSSSSDNREHTHVT